jgi:hypothetical protein
MHKSTPVFPWLLLFGRTALFLALQALFTLAFAAAGSTSAWDAGAGCWPFGVTIANLICLAGLVVLFRREGKNYWEIFRIRREHLKSDLWALLGFLVVAGPVGFLPNVLLAGWLFGDASKVLPLLIRPLPYWAVFAAILVFPLTQGLVELAIYFLYVLPRLADRGLPRWLAFGLAALMLGLQHAAIPFVLDLRFIAWRGFMFLPFAVLVGLMLAWRPRLLPYLAGVHVLMDVSFAVMLLGSAY